MKKIFRGILLLLIYIFVFISFFDTNLIFAETDFPEIKASAAILMEQETGQILYKKNINKKLPPASLTKVLTAVVALENCKPEEMVEVSRRAAYQEGSSIYLEVGEKISMEELLYGILLSSGNDAAVAIAEHVAGSVEDFACLMNFSAEKIGVHNSNFKNPSGLPDSNHYSTAYDLALITRYAMTKQKFVKITGTRKMTISWNDHDWGRGLRNHNKMLWNYPGATGGKTGYTRAAGRCLITTATRKGRSLIAVVLNCPSDWYEVSRLLDYGFSSFEKINIVKKGDIVYQIPLDKSDKNYLPLIADESIDIFIKKGEKLKIRKEICYNDKFKLPLKKGMRIGNMTIKTNDYNKKVFLKAGCDLSYNSKFKKLLYDFKRKLLPNFQNRKKGRQ